MGPEATHSCDWCSNFFGLKTNESGQKQQLHQTDKRLLLSQTPKTEENNDAKRPHLSADPDTRT